MCSAGKQMGRKIRNSHAKSGRFYTGNQNTSQNTVFSGREASATSQQGAHRIALKRGRGEADCSINSSQSLKGADSTIALSWVFLHVILSHRRSIWLLGETLRPAQSDNNT